MLSPIHSLLAEAFLKAGDHTRALEHSLAAARALQLSQSDAFDRRLAALRVSNELDVKNQQLMLAEAREQSAEADRRLSGFIQFVIIVSLLVVLILLYLYLSRSANQREARAQREAAAQLQAVVEARTMEVEEALQEKFAAEQYHAALEVRIAKDDKLRLIGQLTGGVAHDFNNLMTVIQLSAELLKDDLEPQQQKLAEDILAATSSGQAITRGLLAYARQQVLQPSNIDLCEYLPANESIFKRTIDDSISLRTEVQADAPLVILADPGQLTSSILNLILNAGEASGPGSQIVLSAWKAGGHVCIEVKDEGRGMSEEEVGTATEPFFTTKGPTEGSGLGLSMVEGFMKQSGGELVIESARGVGTAVRLLFQPSDGPLVVDARVREARPMEESGVNILLVEDEEQIRAVCRIVLEKAGYRVTTAENSEDALLKLQTMPNVRLVISDIAMPGRLTGKQLADEISIKIPGLPILLMSGYSQSQPTGYPFLAKPFASKLLLEKVRGLIDFKTKPAVRVI